MKRPWRIFWLAVLLGCSGCTAWVYFDSPGGAPDSASEPVDPTPAGFAALFQRECIDLADLKWVRDEASRRVRWNCFGDDASDCAANAAEMISYFVRMRDGSIVMITTLLDNTLTSVSNCSIDVSDRQAPALRAAIARMRVGAKGFVPVPADGFEKWQARRRTPDHGDLILTRAREFDSAISATFRPDYANGADKAHPWTLYYDP